MKQKLSHLFFDSIQVAVTLILDKLAASLASKSDFDRVTYNLTTKVDELNTQITSMRLKIQSKDTVIESLKQENLAMKAEISAHMKKNNELQQEMKRHNLVFSGFTLIFTESTAGGTGGQHISLDPTIIKMVSFCYQQLSLFDIDEDDISSAYFLAPKKSENRIAALCLLVVCF